MHLLVRCEEEEMYPRCKDCKYCYPMKRERESDPKRHVCVFDVESYTEPPYASPVIPDIYICSCQHFNRKESE